MRAAIADRVRERAEWEPVLWSDTARRAFSPREWRILKHLYAGMDAAWIGETLDCRPADITRTANKADRWMDYLAGRRDSV